MRRDGWQKQAQHLILAHAGVSGGTDAVSGYDRQRRLLKAVTINSHNSGTDDSYNAEVGKVQPENLDDSKTVQVIKPEQPAPRNTATLRILSKKTVASAALATQSNEQIGELEQKLGSAREELAVLENQSFSLQASLDLLANENAHLVCRLAEGDETAIQMSALLRQANMALTEAATDRSRLAAAVEFANEKYCTDEAMLKAQLSAMASRATAAERALARERLNSLVRTKEIFAITHVIADLSRRLVESHTAVDDLRSHREHMKETIATMEAERDSLAAVAFEKSKTLGIESDKMKSHLEATASRAAIANKLVSEVRQNLLEKLEALQRSLIAKEHQKQDLEQLQVTLTQRVNSLLKTIESRDVAAAHAEKDFKMLVEKFAVVAMKLATSQHEIASLNHQLKCNSSVRTFDQAADENAHANTMPLLCKSDEDVNITYEPVQTCSAGILLSHTITL
jgi:chromosome segregation ATPase